MRKVSEVISEIIIFCALAVTIVVANSACAFIVYQPQMPESAKALRKF